MKPRIVFFNRSYWPDSEATGQLLTRLSETLAADYEVEVVAGWPNHTQVDVTADQLKSPEKNGVRITRLRHTNFGKHSIAGRLCNLITFTLMAAWYGLRMRRPDVVIAQTDPFFLPLLGRVLKWWHKCRLICYLQDIYPDIAIAVGKARENWLTGLLRRWLFNAYRKADLVIVLGEDMFERCVQHGVPQSSLQIVENWADCQQVYPVKENNPFRLAQNMDDKFVVMYSGNLGLSHQLEPVIEAAAAFRDNSRILFLFVGEGAQKARLQQLVAEQELQNVRFLSYQPREKLAESLSAADLQLVSILPEAVGCVMPSKIYGVLASGTAMLTICPSDCEIARMIEEEHLGTVCDGTEAETLAPQLVQAIQMYLDQPELAATQGERGRELCVARYDFPILAERFSGLMAQLTIKPTTDNSLANKPSASPLQKPTEVH
ncbi:MAG: glycosyltransferase family 4 protein [Planctomycetaceae bacterium]|nr:glycosyltransferase family 4 protein [Planctomycetaceae bacterium]